MLINEIVIVGSLACAWLSFSVLIPLQRLLHPLHWKWGMERTALIPRNVIHPILLFVFVQEVAGYDSL